LSYALFWALAWHFTAYVLTNPSEWDIAYFAMNFITPPERLNK